MDKLFLKGQSVLVVGAGRSGLAAARLCVDNGAVVTITDARPAEQLTPVYEQFGDRVRYVVGGHPTEVFVQADLIVLSPGVPPLPALTAASQAGVPIIGEMELAARFVQAPIVGITGTNGKSTTTTLVGLMLEQSRRHVSGSVFCGGNLGQPLSEAIDTPAVGKDGVVVLEISSFQLETVQTFHAHIAALLNLTEDHLDRYDDYDSYKRAKARLFERQTAQDYIVVNGEPDQAACRELAQHSPAQLLTFQTTPASDYGAWSTLETIYIRLPGRDVEQYPRAVVHLAGKHNLQNVQAALLCARLAGASPAACLEALNSFSGLAHRMQLVRQLNDVYFYNDSKATNVGSVVGSLTGFERPVVLIAGGKDKGGDYGPLVPIVKQVCRAVVLIGAAAPLIERALKDTVPLYQADDLPAAVQKAYAVAAAGDAVILSPACSSYDMFQNYEHRAQIYVDAVRAL